MIDSLFGTFLQLIGIATLTVICLKFFTKNSQNEATFGNEREAPPSFSREAHSLNHTSNIIFDLAKPMASAQNECSDLVTQLNSTKHYKKVIELKALHKEKEEMEAQELYIQVDDLEQSPLDYPTTVCTASKCVKVINFQGQQKINYTTRCHEGCSQSCDLGIFQTNLVGHLNLKQCSAMDYRGRCINCGCAWEVHMHMTTEYNKVKRTIKNVNKEKQIKSIEDSIKQIEDYIDDLHSKLADYQAEIAVMQEVIPKFAVLLSNSYANKNKIKSIADIQDMEAYRRKLLSLKISGPQFEQMGL